MTFRASTEPYLVQADLAQQGLMQDDMVQQGLVKDNMVQTGLVQLGEANACHQVHIEDFFNPENKLCPQPMHQQHPKITTTKIDEQQFFSFKF